MDLEKLITAKRSELEKEKMLLGLIPVPQFNVTKVSQEVESINQTNPRKQVTYEEKRVIENDNGSVQKEDKDAKLYDLEEEIPPDLERYIRKYIGLPGMLKTGEYSPNNPLTRSERSSSDVLLGLGEYERRRNTLRKIRQQQYKEYLDQQAKKKQEAKEKADNERREREDRERLREERERERLERERERSPELRRTNFNYGYQTANSNSSNNSYSNKVDTGVQVGFSNRPLSVAVQTDDAEFFPLSFPPHAKLTLAERELSPRCVVEADDRPIQPAAKQPWDQKKSYHYDAEPPFVKKSNREKLTSDLKHTYMPSIFDADAIELRNMQAEKEAAERRQYYQQELKNQIEEQQRIREERKAREKMLEQAEMRRLEEQLRMLRMAQEKEIDRQHDITNTMKESSTEYETKRKNLQKEIDLEHESLLRSRSQPCRVISNRNTYTSHSDTSQNVSKLPFYYPNINEDYKEMYDEYKRQPFPKNIPENSGFPLNYDVDSYLRRNLNPSKENLNKFNDSEIDRVKNIENKPKRFSFGKDFESKNFETAIFDENPKDKLPNLGKITERAKKHDMIKRKDTKDVIDESLPIPVLRHSPKNDVTLQNNSDKVSDAMKLVEDKWKVPAVQKNILKSFPNEKGKNISILTQLGSIRRQLQLEQLKLDQNVMKDDNTT